MKRGEGTGFLPPGTFGRMLLAAGVIFQLSVVFLFYSQLYPNIMRLMPDDAFYYLKIAGNIGNGMGSVFSAGEPTNGYHPLWMGLLVALHRIVRPGTEPFILLVLLLSVILNSVTALLLRRFLGRLGFSEEQRTLGMGLYLLMPWLVLLNLSGLETPLFFLCLLLFFIGLQRLIDAAGEKTRNYVLFGLSAGLLFLSRTDSAIIILTGSALLLWRKKSLRALPGMLAAGTAALIVSLPWLLWCAQRFGSPVQSSGFALSYLRWHSMPPVDSPGFWLLNGGRLFHKLSILFLSPFVHHAEEFDTILPVWCDAVMLAAVAAAVFLMMKNRKTVILPAFIWLPAVLTLVFYTFVRIASAVWHMSAFALILLFVILNLVGWARDRRRIAALLLLACLALNLYTLGNGYYYPQQVDDPIEWARRLDGGPDGTLRIGSTDAGYLGYFSRRHLIINLDGVVNQSAFEHIRAGTLGGYIDELHLDQVNISPEALEFYCRND
jgi:hypothetical protein